MKIIKYSALILIGVVVIGVVWFMEFYPKTFTYVSSSISETTQNMAAVFFRQSITVAELNKKYQKHQKNPSAQSKINVLVIPGHEPDLGGAQYGKIIERDINVDLGNYLVDYLKNNNHYNAIITRDKKNWNPIFYDYFKSNWDAIVAFVGDQKFQMKSLMDVGLVKTTPGAYHTNALQEVALRLYGINKWANENDVDIEIHIHFNEFPRRRQSQSGEYSGMTIYVPESQFSNSVVTKAIAKAVLDRLSKYNAVSNLATENAGVVEDQELIAIGSYNSADAASLLIEYGYLYELQFQDPAIRDLILKDMAYQTYLGLQDFFGQENSPSVKFDTLLLPYKWQKNITKTSSGMATADILALQSALVVDGIYPVEGQSKNDCPRTGFFGNCTVSALKAFQEKHCIKGESGFVGTKTRATLNSMFGSK